MTIASRGAEGDGLTRAGTAASTLVIQTAFLGDVILTTPLLSVLAHRHGPVDVITSPAAAPLLAGHPAVREVIRYAKRGDDRGWGGLLRLGRALRERGYRRVYLPHRSWRSGALAWLAHAPARIGFRDGARVFYTQVVTRPRRGHEVDRLLALAGPGETKSYPVSISWSPDDAAAAEGWMAAHRVEPGFVALAPGSIWGTKRWPYYDELAAGVAGDVVVIGGPDDWELGQQIVQRSDGRARNACGALSLPASAALLRHASLLVTNDSAPLHLATAVATPIVAIFGPTVPGFGFGPRATGDIVVERDRLSCRPCSRHGPPRCPLGHHRCMRDIPVQMVLEAVARVRNGSEARAG